MLPFVIKIFDLSIFEWPFYTGFTVHFDFRSFVLNMLLVFLDILRLNITHVFGFFYAPAMTMAGALCVTPVCPSVHMYLRTNTCPNNDCSLS